jgi:hypothetical protein
MTLKTLGIKRLISNDLISPSYGGIGSRMFLILLSLFIIAAAIIVLLANQQKNEEKYSRKAMEITEYGMLCILETLGKKPSWVDGFPKTSYEKGWYSAKISRHSKGDTVFCTVETIGHIGNISKKQECLLRLSIVNGDSVWIRIGGQ